MNAVTGNFSYPHDSNLQFDYRDSVVTSWVTDDSYALEGVLSLWTWLLNGQKNWTLSMLEAVPANGSKSVTLDVGPTSDFLGQFNINYNNNNGIEQRYLSPMFSVIHHPEEISPVTWNQQALSTTSSESLTSSILQAASTSGSPSPSSTPSVSTSTGASKTSNPTPHLAAASTDRSLTTSATTLALTSTGTSKPSNPNPHLAMAIGLGVGITFCVAVMGLIGFLYRKKKMNSDRIGSLEMPQKPTTFVNEGKIMGELDAQQRHLELSVGRLDAELDGNYPRF